MVASHAVLFTGHNQHFVGPYLCVAAHPHDEEKEDDNDDAADGDGPDAEAAELSEECRVHIRGNSEDRGKVGELRVTRRKIASQRRG